MKNRSVLKFFLIYFGFTVVSNFVHSITPAFLQMIQAPSYINGVAFSVMSLCSFFASPFWGKMGDRKPYPQLMAVGFFGYALGQFFFSIARGVPMLLFARVISGLLNGALAVNALSYLISVSDSENRGQYLAMFAMLQSVGTCIGYLIGGAVVIEVIFNLPGMGMAILSGIQSSYTMLVQGVVLCVAITFIIINIIVDMLYILIDPRIRTV